MENNLKAFYSLPNCHFPLFITVACLPLLIWLCPGLLLPFWLRIHVERWWAFQTSLPFINNLFLKTTKMLQTCKTIWTALVPDMDDEDWEDVWDAPFPRLVSVRDRLLHYTFLHRVYPTPAKLAKMFRDGFFSCWHFFLCISIWECPHIQTYRMEVLQCI